MIKIECIICGETISSPKVGQLCCSKKKCIEKFNANQLEILELNQEREYHGE